MQPTKGRETLFVKGHVLDFDSVHQDMTMFEDVPDLPTLHLLEFRTIDHEY
jgi:hypothetical protein